jgi:hypothetical protein
MRQEITVRDRILKALLKMPDSRIRIEELVCLFPDLMWSQIFHELRHLSHKDQVCLILENGWIVVRKPDGALLSRR